MANANTSVKSEGLLMAMEISEKTWRLCFTDLANMRMVDVAAWAQSALIAEIAKAKKRFDLPEDAPVHSCYEAGRLGFSLHRLLDSKGIQSLVVDPSSIEVNRRSKSRKTDRLDAEKLCRMLVRYQVYGEKKCWQVCHVPTREQEAERRLDREYERLLKERKGHESRIQSLLRLHGVQTKNVRKLKPGAIRDFSGELLERSWQDEIERELERLKLVDRHLSALAKDRRSALTNPVTQSDRDAVRLMALRGIGVIGGPALAKQFFSWRDFRNVREVGAAAGLASCPYDSGTKVVDQGISKAGHRRIRTLAVELAWLWVHYQPGSALSKWYDSRFAHGSKRLRRIGIVAVARKLLVALWKYLRQGIIPEGAVWDPAVAARAGGLVAPPEPARDG